MPVGSPELKLEMATATGAQLLTSTPRENVAWGELAEQGRFDLAIWFSDLFIFIVARRAQPTPPKCHLVWRLGGDSSKGKGRPEGRPFKLALNYQRDSWLRG